MKKITQLKIKKSTTILHLWYWIFFLVVVLIVIITAKCTNIPNFTDYLTNAATFVSLVLALVAIFYSFISTSDLSNSLSDIRNASKDISDSKKSIADFTKQTSALAQGTRDAVENLNIVKDSLNIAIENFHEGITAVSEKTENLRSLLHTLPQKIDTIDARMAQMQDGQTRSQIVPNHSTKSKGFDFEFFISYSSVSGLFLISMLKEAHIQKKRIVLDAFCEETAITDSRYAHAWIVAIYAMRLISLSRTEEVMDHPIAVDYISPELAQFDVVEQIRTTISALEWDDEESKENLLARANEGVEYVSKHGIE